MSFLEIIDGSYFLKKYLCNHFCFVTFKLHIWIFSATCNDMVVLCVTSNYFKIHFYWKFFHIWMQYLHVSNLSSDIIKRYYCSFLKYSTFSGSTCVFFSKIFINGDSYHQFLAFCLKWLKKSQFRSIWAQAKNLAK